MPDYDTDPEEPEEPQDEDASQQNDGWGPSDYNSNKGIKLTVLFTPILVSDPTKKRRANAKAPVLTKLLFIHEDFTLRDALSKILILIKREDLIPHSWLYQGQELDDPDSFTLSYTIPRRVTEQIAISDERDFKQMMEEATKKDAAEAKVYIVEQKNDAETDEDSEHEEAPAAKKKKGHPSGEELSQATIIQDLERRHRCEDRQCGKTPCYVAGPEAEHIHLTHMHLRTWAAAIVDGKLDGVDRDTPPNSKIFDPTHKPNTDNIAQLSKRRLSHIRNAEATGVTVNFPGFADIFRQSNAQLPVLPLGPLPVPNGIENRAPRLPPAPLPPMKLDVFCATYSLSDEIKTKLASIHIAGPHVLSLISDVDLRAEGKLSIGELASIRDAQIRWNHAAGAP